MFGFIQKWLAERKAARRHEQFRKKVARYRDPKPMITYGANGSIRSNPLHIILHAKQLKPRVNL